MKKKYLTNFNLRIVIILVAIFSIAFVGPIDSFAKGKKAVASKTAKSKKSTKKSKKTKKCKHPRRSYNPEKTRLETQEIIRNSSQFVSELAGLRPYAPATTLEGLSTDSVLMTEGENLSELEREDDIVVNFNPDDMDFFKTLVIMQTGTGSTNSLDATDGGINYAEIMNSIMQWVGTPYYFGGTSGSGIDCSAFVQTIFYKSANIVLPRTARDQCTVGEKISYDDLKFGDMVFFHTYSKSFASHVGIYLSDHLFAHASSRYGVTVSSLESTYYNKRFIGGRRLGSDDIMQLTATSNKDKAESTN